MGRLFDAVASLAGLVQTSRFEGQAAMALEAAAEGCASEEPYRFAPRDLGQAVIAACATSAGS